MPLASTQRRCAMPQESESASPPGTNPSTLSHVRSRQHRSIAPLRDPLQNGSREEIFNTNPAATKQELAIRRMFFVERIHPR